MREPLPDKATRYKPSMVIFGKTMDSMYKHTITFRVIKVYNAMLKGAEREWVGTR